jgi:hypothetical protein
MAEAVMNAVMPLKASQAAAISLPTMPGATQPASAANADAADSVDKARTIAIATSRSDGKNKQVQRLVPRSGSQIFTELQGAPGVIPADTLTGGAS